MVFSGWRAGLIVLAALVLIGVLLTAIFWLALLVGAVLGVAWFNLLLMPRLAVRLRLPQVVLAIALLVLLAAGGFGLAGVTGAIEGAAVWLLGVAAPRVVLWRVRRRIDRRTKEPMTIVLPYRP